MARRAFPFPARPKSLNEVPKYLERLESFLQEVLVAVQDERNHDHERYIRKTGWNASRGVTLSWSDSTRTLTVTPSSTSFSYWISGVKYTHGTAQSVQITNTEGPWFIFFDGDTLTASQTAWDIDAEDKAPVAYVYWDATNGEAIRVSYEMHGWLMDGATHEYLHDVFGSQWETGLEVGFNGGSAGGTSLDVSSGTIHDEDIEVNIEDDATETGLWHQDLSPANWPILYRSGSGGLWRKTASSTASAYVLSNIPQINTVSGSTWSWTNVGVNEYFAYWVIASPSITKPVFIVPGQVSSGTLDDARTNNTIAAMSFGDLPTPEHKVLARVILRRKTLSPYYETIEIADYRDAA